MQTSHRPVTALWQGLKVYMYNSLLKGINSKYWRFEYQVKLGASKSKLNKASPSVLDTNPNCIGIHSN